MRDRVPQLEDKEMMHTKVNRQEESKQKLIRVVLRYDENHGRVTSLNEYIMPSTKKGSSNSWNQVRFYRMKLVLIELITKRNWKC